VRLEWSRNPGCFERHLQRKCGNPLFPPEVRDVTQREIADARKRDSIEAEDARNRFLALIRRIAANPGTVPTTEALDVRKEFDDLLTRAAEIGDVLKDDMPEIFQMYESVVRDILASSNGHPDLGRKLGNALTLSAERRKLFNNSFVAQLRRPDTPIQPNEVVPSLLGETPNTIRLMVEMLSDQPEVVGVLQRATAELMANSSEVRNILRKQPEKLSALGLDTSSAN
jgi:hypothetical protein